jgi:hypothetical protein
MLCVTHFCELWIASTAQKDTFAGGVAAWWEQAAKPAIRAFCCSFSKTLAIKTAHSRHFFTWALEHALAVGDWFAVEECRGKLLQFDRAAAEGLAVGTHVPLLPDKLPNIFLLASEGCHGRWPGLEAVKTADGQVLTEPLAVQAKIFCYFETLFQGCHTVNEAVLELHDSGHSFEPSYPEATAAILADLPCWLTANSPLPSVIMSYSSSPK